MPSVENVPNYLISTQEYCFLKIAGFYAKPKEGSGARGRDVRKE